MVSSRSYSKRQLRTPGLRFYRLDRPLLLPLEREPLLDDREPPERIPLLRPELREPDDRTPLLRLPDDERPTERPLLPLERLGARCTERPELLETFPLDDELLEPELYDLDEPLLADLDDVEDVP